MKIKNKQNSIVRRPAYNTWAFTLVELIVVITILAILGTIAFISLQGYSAQARDSKRLSDISNIKKSVELFSLNTGKYPEPDDSVTMSYSGEVLRYQGTVGDQVSTNLSRNLQEKPVGPLTGSEYVYSTTYSQTEYEVLGLYESDLIGFLPHPIPLLTGEGTRALVILSSNAEMQDYPKIDGNYNGIYIKTPSFYVPTPSIINAEIISNDDLDDDMIKSQIVTGGDNLPLASTGGLNVNLSVYNGTITENSTDEEKMILVDAIQVAYSGSDLADDTMYADLLSRTGTGELVDFVDVVVLGKAEYTNIIINNNETDTTGTVGNDSYTAFLLHGEDFIDSSNSNHTITTIGNTEISDTGKFGKSIYFDGTGDYLSIGDNEDWDFGTGDFTIDFWINHSRYTNVCETWIQFGGYGNFHIERGRSGLRGGNMEIRINSNIHVTTYHPSTLNEWYHIAVVRHGDYIDSYVNGVKDTAGFSITDYINSGDLSIGEDKNLNHPFQGYIDEFRVSKGIARTLDPDDYMYDPEGDGFDVPTQEYGN